MRAKRERGQIVKIIANRYTVRTESGDRLIATARGRLRLDSDPYVGDFVTITRGKPVATIDEILPRKNSLIRPYVANVDAALIVVAPEPKPDLVLADKIILNCYAEGIEPVLVATKNDLGDLAPALQEEYPGTVIISVSSATKNGLNELSDLIQGKTVCLAGQSAVGKTSLLNALLDLNLKTDGLSAKIKRGKNTTRHVEIYEASGGSIVDTCGFSMLECVDLKENELTYYYDEFVAVQDGCRYRGCTHTTEPDCAVKRAVAEGSINAARYQRYLTIFEEIKEARRKQYD